MESTNKQVELILLGDIRLTVEGSEISLPKSRKARALLAYLALSKHSVSRSWLSEFLFHNTSDPKGNLRWCISRLEACYSRLENGNLISRENDALSLTIQSESVDIIKLQQLSQNGPFQEAEYDFLEHAASNTFLSGLELNNAPSYDAWRATTQSNISPYIEKALESASGANTDNQLSEKYARLFINYAPHRERAWIHLITAAQRLGKDHEAKCLLETAHQQLRSNGVIPTKLAFQVAPRSNAEKQATTIKESTLAINSLQQTLSLEISKENPCTASATIESDIRASVSRYNTFELIAPHSNGAHKQNSDLALKFTLLDFERTKKLELQLIDNNFGVSVYTNQLELPSNRNCSKAVQSWISECLEVDVPMALYVSAKRKNKLQLTATDHYHLALANIHSPVGYSATRVSNLLEQALTKDPHSGPALCALSWVRSMQAEFNASVSSREDSAAMARRAIEFSYNDASIVAWAGINIACLELNAPLGLTLAKRALKLNPYSPMAILASSLTSHYCCDYVSSLKYLKRLDKSNIEPLRFLVDTCYSLNYYQLQMHDKAIAYGKSAADRNPNYGLALRILAASQARAEKYEDAQTTMARLLDLNSALTLEHIEKYSQYTKASATQRLCQDLYQAGLPLERAPNELPILAKGAALLSQANSLDKINPL